MTNLPSVDDLLDPDLPHWREARGLAYALLRDHWTADDICQEARIRLQQMPDLDRSRPVRELVLTIVRRLSLSERRRKRPELLGDDAMHVDPTTPPANDIADREDRRKTLNDALADMDPVWRAMLYLKDGLGLRYREIADVLDKTEDVVRVTLHRARIRARERLMASQAERTS